MELLRPLFTVVAEREVELHNERDGIPIRTLTIKSVSARGMSFRGVYAYLI